jgi:hypothetical protein
MTRVRGQEEEGRCFSRISMSHRTSKRSQGQGVIFTFVFIRDIFLANGRKKDNDKGVHSLVPITPPEGHKDAKKFTSSQGY